jgi:uncharacterized protein (DUF697 family)
MNKGLEANEIAAVTGILNGILVNGHAVGEILMVGPGAGSLPTASAVVGDTINLASALQKGVQKDKHGVSAEIIIMTQSTKEQTLRDAITEMQKCSFFKSMESLFRVFEAPV